MPTVVSRPTPYLDWNRGTVLPLTDFFVSYTGADRQWAEWIAWQIEAAGYSTILQAWDFRPGSNFVLDMRRGSESERTIAVLSPAYQQAPYAQLELSVAIAKDPTGKHGALLPVRVVDFQPEAFLLPHTYIDLVGLDAEAARRSLLAGVRRERAKPVAEPPFPGGVAHQEPLFPGGGTDTPTTPALPSGSLPEPGPLPPGSSMPLERNRLFVGREGDLLALAKTLLVGQAAAIGEVPTAAASGLGGLGKSQLACEFAYRYGRLFAGGVFWLGCSDPAAVPAEVAALGGPLYLALGTDFAGKTVAEQAELVRREWERATPRLLVFDNCEDEEVLRKWRPRSGGCRVLVTAHRPDWDPLLGVQPLHLGVLNRQESVALLRKHRPDLLADDADLDAIAEELGDLPLALHLAGSFLWRYQHGVAPARYLGQLQRPGLLDHRSLVAGGLSPTAHVQHVGRTFALSYERLLPEDVTDALALRLLARAAYFAAGEPIPRKLLAATLGEAAGDDEALLSVEDALLRLVELGLLEEQAAGALQLHRLLAAFVRQVAPDATAQEAVEQALLEEAGRRNAQGYAALLLPLQRHLRAVTDAARSREDNRAAALCSVLGHHLYLGADYAGAWPYYERALAIRETVLGPAHPDTAASLNNLGSLLQDQGDYTGARPYLERALAIREKALGPDHPDTAASLNNLGSLLYAQGDYTGARPYLERALAIREKALGPDHPNTAASLNNLATLLQAQGDYTGARPRYERALAIREKALGPDHPDTASSIGNLGFLLQLQGDYAAARPYLERALAARQKLGDRYQEGVLFFILGKMAAQQDRLAEGVRLVALCVLIDRSIDHPDTANDQQALEQIMAPLGYTQQQVDALLEDVGHAYAADRGWGLLTAAFSDR